MFNINFEIMLVFSCVDIKTSGVSFVSNTVSDFTSEDQTAALHMVVHDVFKDWSEFFVVYEVEENFLISCDINSDITFDEIKQTLMLKFVALGPVPFFSFLIINSFEE
jgi:hypothetical protein